MMTATFKIALLAAAFLSLADPLVAEWVIHVPSKNEAYYDYANFLVIGKGEPEDTATIKIKYQINGKWLIAHETDTTVNDKGKWETDCEPPVPLGGRWPVADGSNPTPYRLELYEGKTFKTSVDFKVVDSRKKPKESR